MKLIPLHDKTGEVVAHVQVDDEDFGSLRWCRRNGRYAGRDEARECVYLHRAIMGLSRGDKRQVDHMDRDPLNCQRSNMRVVPNQAANSQNLPPGRGRSRFRGVHWHAKAGKWAAEAMLNRKAHHLGLFQTEEAAGAAARAWRKEHMPFAIEGTLDV